MKKILFKISDGIKVFSVAAIMVIIVATMIMEIASKKKDYSESENRHLATFPEISFETIKNGDFTKGVENYLCDHFPFRDSFMHIYAYVQRVEGKKEINGVYLCDDGYYIEKNEPYKNTDKFVSKIKGLCDNYSDVNITLMMVPTAITINKDKLPKNADGGTQLEEIEKVKGKLNNYSDKLTICDVTNELMEGAKEGAMYYKTDHHWTTLGAYYAFKKYCKDNGLSDHGIEEYELNEVSKDFYGTISSKVNDTKIKPDKIVSFDKDRDLEVMYQSGLSDSLYNEEYLDKKDKYSYFLNNINDKIIITNKSIKEDRKGKTLLVYKDSYANCFVPFLTDEFETIIVLDSRYYMYGGASLAKDFNVTDILVLYNMNTVDTDTGINGIY